MSTTQADTVVSLTIGQLEALIRRVVREELAHYQPRPPSVADDWSHEGPDDPEGDEVLAREAMAQIEEYERNPYPRLKWEDVKAELARAEAAGELPD
jgi:hypothetical protein